MSCKISSCYNVTMWPFILMVTRCYRYIKATVHLHFIFIRSGGRFYTASKITDVGMLWVPFPDLSSFSCRCCDCSVWSQLRLRARPCPASSAQGSRIRIPSPEGTLHKKPLSQESVPQVQFWGCSPKTKPELFSPAVTTRDGLKVNDSLRSDCIHNLTCQARTSSCFANYVFRK